MDHTKRSLIKMLHWPHGVVILLLLLLLLPGAVPARWWLEVPRIEVPDVARGEPVLMSVERTINRPFVADWDVLVRRQVEGGWRIVCAAHGGGDYRPDAVLPPNLTLGWWTDGACQTLDSGVHIVTTSWEIETGFPLLVPPRRLTVQSAPFLVH